jgi:arylsulfatase
MKPKSALLASVFAALPLFASVKGDSATATRRPNVLVFLLDDVGFGQLSAFGGAVNTPNIDRVANLGLRYSNFHTTALCSPSRAALLTGRNHHSVGAGVVTEIATDHPGYTSHIPKEKFPVVEVFRQSGYGTAAFGKWHNTPLDQLRGPESKHDQWPTDLGFERFYGFMAGDMSQWEPTVWDNTRPIEPHNGRADYHFTTDMADQAIRWLDDEHRKNPDKPFFLYFATGAAHAPHHAPADFITKYRGRFDHGWDKVREETIARQKSMGMIPSNTELSERPDVIPAWDSLSKDEKRLYARMQETFAAYLDHADAQFGRVLAEVERLGQLEDTIILITSDNGASGEGGLHGSVNENLVFNAIPDELATNLARFDDIGTKKAYNHYPAGWALVGNTPFRYWKQTVHEGGVHDPMVIAWPKRIKDAGGFRDQFTHIVDVAPTLMELTEVSMPESIHGIAQAPMEGVSFAKTVIEPDATTGKKIQYFEMLGNRALWSDGWKVAAFHGRYPWVLSGSNPDFAHDKWELFNLANDFSETRDLAGEYPELLESLKAKFDEQAKTYNVYPLDDGTGDRVATTYESLIGGITHFKYGPEDVRVSEALSPPIKNRSYSVSAELGIPDGSADGTIVACGGRFGGYSLYVKDKRLHFVHNFLAESEYRIDSNEDLPKGSVTVRFEFVKTGDFRGMGSLFVNDKKVGEGLIERTVPKRFGIAETFDVGEDSGSAVTEQYAAPFRFPGRIAKVEFQLR